MLILGLSTYDNRGLISSSPPPIAEPAGDTQLARDWRQSTSCFRRSRLEKIVEIHTDQLLAMESIDGGAIR
ncbi:hypothetical protein L484_017877 [Morus notabilis]|uniref:Uncharacterized protein n=1 Tax=Morus notabilis TaxID=981085 RepID=W9S873_9ROSA|nr:hypothetical protein L484_017877 [Morus notabilis]